MKGRTSRLKYDRFLATRRQIAERSPGTVNMPRDTSQKQIRIKSIQAKIRSMASAAMRYQKSEHLPIEWRLESWKFGLSRQILPVHRIQSFHRVAGKSESAQGPRRDPVDECRFALLVLFGRSVRFSYMSCERLLFFECSYAKRYAPSRRFKAFEWKARRQGSPQEKSESASR